MSGYRLFAIAFSLLAALAAAGPGTARADKAATGIMLGGAAFLAYSLAADPPQDDEPDVVTFGTGVFDAVDEENSAALLRIEYRPELLGLRTGPLLGLAGTTDGGILGYGGVRHDVLFEGGLLVCKR